MLNTTNASNTTATPTKSAAKSDAVISELQSPKVGVKYTVQRYEAKTGKLAFSFTFSELLVGKTYGWLCEATSLSPSAPAFRTAMERGSATTSPAPKVEEKGSSALWSSLFAAVLLVVTVFFY